MEKKQTWNIVYWAIALMLLVSLQDVWQSATQVEVLPYSEFEKALEEGRIAKVTISDNRITGLLKQAEGRKTTLVASRMTAASTQARSHSASPNTSTDNTAL